MPIAVVIASTKRADVLASTLESIRGQSRVPDEVVLSVTAPSDLPPTLPIPVTTVIGAPGAARQRNAGLGALRCTPMFVAFLDDDIILHRDYLANMERLFLERAELVLAMGHLLANGNVSTDDAFRLLARCEETDDRYYPVKAAFGGVYGCNMCIRFDISKQEPFDERLSLYSIMEDVDIGSRVRRYGEIGYYFGSVAVHLRAPGGRVSHQALGYSEVMNPIYLGRKGSIPMKYALLNFLLKMPVKNAVLSIMPSLRRHEHRKRLIGNLRAAWDVALGRVKPERVIEIGD